MTNQELIDKVLLELGVIAEGDSGSDTQSADMLDMLNSMMASWAVNDMDLQFPPQDTLGDTCPIPVWAELPIINNLAVYSAASFDGFIHPTLPAKASSGASLVAKICINAKLKPVDMSYLPVGVAGGSRYNITTDS